MSTKFYEYENCSENSLINFDKCISLYGIGNNIKTTEDYSSWINLENCKGLCFYKQFRGTKILRL